MRILSVVGARPQFVKLAPIGHAIAGRAEHVIVHTGQHYHEQMSDVFFRDLDIPAPNINLNVGSNKHGAQTAAMIEALESTFERFSPDCVLTYGDTNSTLAAAIAAVKMGIPIAHLEAGLRSFNRRMPEEHNRVIADHTADLCLAPSEVAMEHLRIEGLGSRSVLVGDVMTDILYETRDRIAGWPLPAGVDEGGYYLSTIHRPSNTDSRDRLTGLIEGLASLDKPVLLAAHPRLVDRARDQEIELQRGAIRVVEPMAYPVLVAAVRGSAGVITDSGGLQKEAFLLRVPCTTIRSETEWVETVELGWNVLVGSDDLLLLSEVVGRPWPRPTDAAPYGDGNAARRVIDELLELGASFSRA